MIIRALAIPLLILIALSCNSEGQNKIGQKEIGKKEMADLNRYMVRKDRERIENYIVRKGLKMTETRSGLWFMIKKEGNGRNFTDKDKVIMEYECSLLDGTAVYSSKERGLKEVVLGSTRIEPGLDQGLRMLKPEGEAMFIIPPFLGWGLPGDGEKIPSRSVLVYNIKIVGNN